MSHTTQKNASNQAPPIQIELVQSEPSDEVSEHDKIEQVDDESESSDELENSNKAENSDELKDDVEQYLDEIVEQAEELPVIWINHQEDMVQLLSELETCKTEARAVALDTEFIKRDTYYAILALLQINTGSCIYLLDVPKLQLSEFWQSLSELPVTIWHACGEDLGIFYMLSGLPPLNNVFDTQIALSYITGQWQMGYQGAVESILDIHLEKGESQSNWLARPLTYEQELYAVDDVRYLLPLYQQLVNLLNKKNWYQQVIEDCQYYAEDLYKVQQISDEDQYLSSVDFRHTGVQRAFLQELLTWRERLARSTNQPRTFIIRKQGIRELTEFLPTSLRQLRQQTSIHRSIIDKYGNEILRIVQQAQKSNAVDHPPSVPAGYRSKDKTLEKLIKNTINNHSDSIGISANVLMKKKWQSKLFELIALNDIDWSFEVQHIPKGLQGWRSDWILNEMIPLLKDNRSELRAGMGIS